MRSTVLHASAPLLRGFGLAAVVYWIAACLAPISALLGAEDPNIFMEWFFLVTGALPVFVVYLVLRFMAKPATRRSIDCKLRKMFGPLAVYATLWVTLYPILA